MEKEMNYIKKLTAVLTMLLVVLCTGCGAEKGTPPELLVDGTSLIVGESMPVDLTQQGFETNDLGAMILELPDRSWTSAIFLEKDGKNYCSLTLVNDSKESKNVYSCVIEEVGFFSLDGENADLNITLNGANPIGMTEEELKAAYPELEMDDDESSEWKFHNLDSGSYSISFQCHNGVLTDIDVRHEFSKSYEAK